MSRGVKRILTVSIVMLLLVALGVGAILIKKYSPSREQKALTEYFGVEQGSTDVIVVLQDTISETRGKYIDGKYYLNINQVSQVLNERFYWDQYENTLIYTTSTDVIKAAVGETGYSVNQSKTDTDYVIVKVEGSDAYVALDFVKQYSGIKYETFENPYRVVIQYRFGEEEQFVKVEKDTKIRVEPGIKFAWLEELDKEVDGDAKLRVLDGGADQGVEKNFLKVISADGVEGYVLKKHVSDVYKEAQTSDFVEEAYPHIQKEGTINMVWHQVTSEYANEELLNLLSSTKGVTTISPTWFTVSNTKGNITSLASETYVQRAHLQGVEVWGLCGDVEDDSVDMLKLLSHTNSREKLEKEILSAAIKYDLDGINIDFERITQECGVHFIQFIRELGIRCRNNGIVLAIDNYPPTEGTSYYNRREQAKVADYVVTMAYDEHYNGSEESGSVSSIGFVQDAVNNTIAEVPASQTIIALPFYTRLWKEVSGKKPTSETYSMSNAEACLINNGAKKKWDDAAGQNYGEFKQDGATFKMWLEDEESLKLKLDAASEAGVAGYSFWKLGLEKSNVWNTIVKYAN